jgi:hypothetical protein
VFVPCVAEEGRGGISEGDVARAAEAHGFLWDEAQVADMVSLFAQVRPVVYAPRYVHEQLC